MAMAAAPASLGTVKATLCVCSWCEHDGNSSVRLLPCLHNVCDTCLSKCVTDNKIGPGDKLSCKFCEQYFTMPAAGVTGFSINTLASSLHFLTQMEDDLNCDACQNISVKQQSKEKCVDCDELVCNKCLLQHKGAKLTSLHCVLSLDEIKADIENYCNLRAKKHFKVCSFHPTERLKYFCTQCSLPICGDCKIIKHDLHTSVLLDNVASKCNRDLSDLSATLNETISKHKKHSSHLNGQIDRIDHNYQKLVKRIDAYTNTIVQDVRDQSTSVQKRATKNYEKSARDLQTMVQVRENRVKELEQLQKSLTCIQVSASDASKAELCNYVQEQHNSFVHVDQDLLNQEINDERESRQPVLMTFTPSKLNLDQKLGSIVVSQQVTYLGSSSVVPPSRCKESVTNVVTDPVDKRNHNTYSNVKVIHQFKTLQSEDTESQVLSGVAVYGDDIVLVDSENKVTRCFNINGKVKNQFVRPDMSQKVGCPRNVVVVDTYAFVKSSQQQIHVFNCKTGIYMWMWMAYMFRNHTGLAVMPDNQVLYYEVPRKVLCACSTQNPTDDTTLYASRNDVCKVPTSLNSVAYMACNSHNAVALVDPDTKCVYFIDIKGKLLLEYKPRTLQEPAGACADEQGNFYIADTRADCIHMVDYTLTKTEVIGKEAGLNGPLALAFHRNLNSLVVTETSGYVKVLQIP